MFQELYPLTNAQKSIWVADNLYPGTSQANLAATATVREYVDIDLMHKALNLVIKQNDALRIRIVNSDGTPRQYFGEFESRDFDTLDFSYESGEEDFKQWVQEKTEEPFSLIDSELFYFAIIKLFDKTVCFLNLHHMVVDAWGVLLVLRKIFQEYWYLVNGVDRDDAVEPSFIHHINSELRFVDSERFAKQKGFWSGVFETVPEFIEMDSSKSLHSLKAQRKSYVLPSDLSLKLQNFCTVNEVSSFSLFYALLALYLFKRTSKKDIVIGTPVLNRSGNIEKNTVGMFMHNIPTRIYIDPSLDFLAFVNESFREIKKYLRNQRYPYSNILKDFRERHQFSGALMDVTLNFHNARFDSVIDYEGIWHYSGAQANSLSISVSDRAGTGMPILDYDYLLEAFDATEIDQMHANLCNLLTEALDHPEKRLSELSILTQPELNMILKGFNQTESVYDAKTVSELFETEVRKSPDKTALIFEGKCLSYAELNHKANQLAHYLRTQGVGRNTIVGLLVKRSLEMVVGILAILKAGAAYLPVDPSYPHSRIDYIFKQSNVKLILTNIDNVEGTNLNCLFEDISFTNKEIYEGFDGANLEKTAEPNDLAYVLYTSGSTGNPKGVMVQHTALCNLIHGIAQALDLGDKTILSLTTISFDIFFLETILPLAQGMRVVIANEDEQVIPKQLLGLIHKYHVNMLQATPSRIKLILDESRDQQALTQLSYVLIGGEEFPGSLLPELEQTTSAEIFNMYGPTETTVWSTMKKLTANEKITIGRPMANTQIYILDEYLAPVPNSSVGEIFIAGDGVSLGYLNNSELTLERFLDNPFSPGTKMYKTGDLGRWLSSGDIEFLGRNDNQVKIRGFRIELGEIEARLAEHALINEAVATVRADKTGKKHLCAYVTGNRQVPDEELKSHLLKSLPSYMIPAWFMWLDHLPLTPNGKLDRKSLSGPMEFPNGQEAGIVAPRNDIELKLASLWAEALQRDKVGINDNMFALGGDSLTILEIMSGALSEGWKLSAQDFYEWPTIRDLAAKIGSGAVVNSLPEEEIFHNKWELAAEYELKPVDIGNVLLTGATGFLGIHLLKEVLEQSRSEIYCLVRGSNVQQRLHDLINFYFPAFPHVYFKRIKVLSGDITAKNFGLTQDGYHSLAKQVQTVIHSAALVDHYGQYTNFETVNVEGTSEVINFCLRFNKKLNHISTVSVSGNFKIDYNKPEAVFKENDFFIGQDYKSNVYIQSKFDAENQIFKAQRQGLQATIFRVGILTGRYSDGHFQINIEKNAFYRRLKSLFTLRVVPTSFSGQSLELTPVDYCAQAIIKIVNVNQTNGLAFHIFNNEKISTDDFLRILKNLDIIIEILEDDDFKIYINHLSKTKEGKEILSGFISDLVINKKLEYGSNIVVDSTFTNNYLYRLGFAWPNIGEDYLAKIIAYMDKVNFISKAIG
ncbi:MAG: non-ribosomal peptide synthetase family protein [Desulfitobacteriaceae bacterium]